MRTFYAVLTSYGVLTAVVALAGFGSPILAQTCPAGPGCLGSGNPSDAALLNQRVTEKGSPGTSGIFDIAVPDSGTVLTPVQRVPRDKYGVVGPLPLTLSDLDALLYPSSSSDEKNAVLEGLTFFTTVHVPGEGPFAGTEHGVGPMNNQPFCQGCHENAADAVRSRGLLGPRCPNGSICASPIGRAARSTPTNFEFTSLDPATGGGLPPDNLDAIFNTGKTAAFTTFGDFTLSLTDVASGAIGFFDPLDGGSHSLVGQPPNSFVSQPFGGQVQHVRPSVAECVPKPLPPVSFDTNLTSNTNDFRRSIGERAGPPYRGLGLMEAVPTADITTDTDPTVENGSYSSLGKFAKELGCPNAGCISGKANTIPTTTAFVPGVGRFGLRANGVELLQFVVGGMQGELSLTNALNTSESNFPTLFPGGTSTSKEPPECLNASSTPNPEVYLSTVFSIRALMRNTAPPEFGDALLDVLQSAGSAKRWPPNTEQAKVKRGAQLFGIDLVAFANRTIGNPMTATGDGRDLNAINQADRELNCVGCHTPIQRTGQSPGDVDATDPDGGKAVSFVWAPIFSDLLLHKMPAIDAERFLQSKGNLPRDPLVIPRLTNLLLTSRPPIFGFLKVFDTFDIPRNLADDTFTNQKATADGTEFRTAPLMGLGRIGPPFLHDSRVYLSNETVNSTPAGTVTTNSFQTNAPLVVRTIDDAILAAIELHDLPAPDDGGTPRLPGAGCPVPPNGSGTNIDYGPAPKDVICPPYNSTTSQTNRSDSAEVIYRFRRLTPDDQQAVVEFLKQL